MTVPKGHRALVERNIREAEARGDFNCDVDPHSDADAYPVTAAFPYLKKGWKRIGSALLRQFAIKPFAAWETRAVERLKVTGRRNLKGIPAAIVVCNHVYMFDCLACKKAVGPRRTVVAAAGFNNLKGRLGALMRADGMLPLNLCDLKALRNFETAVSYYLAHRNYVLFFPEQSLWRYYPKPRPFKSGAFRFAVANRVPVIPVFLSFRPSGKKDAEGFPTYYTTAHILKPVFPDPGPDAAKSTRELKDAAFARFAAAYEEAYHRPYRPGAEKEDAHV